MLGARAGEGSRDERRAWWRVFCLAALAIGAWAFAVPLGTGPDEGSHVVRAAGVVRGDLIGAKLPIGDNTWVMVRAPADYVDVDRFAVCFLGDPYEPIFGSHRDRADIDACQEITLDQPDQRNQCFADLDKKIMETAPGWVPYLWAKNITVTGSTVTKFEFDQFSGYLSYTQMAVNNNETVPS